MITYRYEQNELDWHTVRETVFIQEQGFCEEFDEIDTIANHVTIYVDGELAGCGRCFPTGKEKHLYTLGRIAVLKPYRKMALGSKILQELEAIARQKGANAVTLDAQCRAMPFYCKAGYHVCGELHMDEHVPHKQMKKEL